LQKTGCLPQLVGLKAGYEMLFTTKLFYLLGFCLSGRLLGFDWQAFCAGKGRCKIEVNNNHSCSKVFLGGFAFLQNSAVACFGQ